MLRSGHAGCVLTGMTRNLARLCAATLALAAAAAAAGCSVQTTSGPVRWTATNPSSPVGQTDGQAWSRSTASSETVTAQTPAAPIVGPTLAPPRPTASTIPVPAGASLAGSLDVNQVRPFPEEAPNATARSLSDETAVVRGTDRTYEVPLLYGDAVHFFDRTLAWRGCDDTAPRTSTRTATLWAVRCNDGELARVAVRNTTPTSIEIVAGKIQ
jgi:hypothetical protein